jgi:hypothetical protein
MHGCKNGPSGGEEGIENSRGRHLNTSLLGKGVWTNKPNTASGMHSRMSLEHRIFVSFRIKEKDIGGSEKERLTVESRRIEQIILRKKTRHIPWNQKTVVIMHPDKVPRFVHLSNTSCKGGIGRFVVWVMGVSGSIFCSDVLPKKVME